MEHFIIVVFLQKETKRLLPSLATAKVDFWILQSETLHPMGSLRSLNYESFLRVKFGHGWMAASCLQEAEDIN